jgi:hypothetical protein
MTEDIGEEWIAERIEAARLRLVQSIEADAEKLRDARSKAQEVLDGRGVVGSDGGVDLAEWISRWRRVSK